MTPELSLVIPAYNEAKNLPLLLERAAGPLGSAGIEMIIVDNGSGDSTQDVLRKLLPCHPFARSVRVDVNQGYGYGILTGLRAAHGKVLAWTHADMQTDPADAVRGMELFKASAQPEHLFVKGRRYGRPAGDRFFTAGMSLFETVLLGHSMSDINAQPTMFARSFFKTWKNP
ncbi:MAG: glycosyltransferase family 2 protein, partial [Bryobacteraceae bacterium]